MTTEADTTILLRGARALLPRGAAERASVLVRGGLIAHIAEGASEPESAAARVIDLEGTTLLPGFVDAHIHGAVGVDVNEADEDALHEVARFLARRGVTAWLPTLVPDAEDAYARAALAVARLMDSQDARPPAARALGLHYEGPFVNSQQCGALRTQFFRAYGGPSDLDALAAVPRDGARHVATVAPEIEGGVELIRELTRRGWVVSVGHTRATVAELERAREAGARHMTHFLNAMSPLHHRAPGPVGWGLVRDDVTVDLIADGVHLDPLALRLVLRCKTPARVALISDSVAPAGLGDGEFRVWGETISVRAGRTSNERGSIAGSVTNLLDAFRLVSALDTTVEDASRMASLNPARLLGVDSTCGTIEEGKRADLVALDGEGRARLTLVGGRVAHEDL
ncbi:MAG TPA: N-acetylglucosamine-6-phosphate deacetylase [Pyrinomonadaceae bacterium]|nr:N-acetylglucosamine-6-phosphate deacetylase [Pyrinomonadaceae bacterium]